MKGVYFEETIAIHKEQVSRTSSFVRRFKVLTELVLFHTRNAAGVKKIAKLVHAEVLVARMLNRKLFSN